MSEIIDVRRLLKEGWCSSFEVLEMPSDGSIHLATPFLHGDGDAYPVIISSTSDGWQITDGGMTASHLGLAQIEFTKANAELAHRIAAFNGLVLSNGLELQVRYPSLPTAFDLADFLKALAQLSALPALRPPHQADQFVRTLKDQVLEWVSAPAERDWKPDVEDGNLFPSDVKVSDKAQSDVYLWFVGDEAKTERASNAIHQYQTWGLPGRPLVAVRADHSDTKSARRLQVTVGADSVVVVDARAPDPLRQRLEELEVAMM